MASINKIKLFNSKNKEIDSHHSNCIKSDESKKKATKLLILFTISSTIVVAGMIFLTIYFLAIENSNVLTKVPSAHLKKGKIATKEYDLSKIPNTKNPSENMSHSAVVLGSMDALQLKSTTTRVEPPNEEHNLGKILKTG